MTPVLTIDGPSGAGKGTVSRILAQHLGFHLLDSGALYRLTALAAINKQIDLKSVERVTEVAQHLAIEFVVKDGATEAWLEGSNVTNDIRSEAVGMGASVVAAYPPVRLALLDRQRIFAQLPGLVADGRDMGTVVFPEATLKIFLTASSAARARRRLLQLEAGGVAANLEDISADIEARDLRDSQRNISPLAPAEDAVLIDSTSFSVDEVVSQIIGYWQAKVAT